MAHVTHVSHVQDSFLYQLEQRQRLDEAFAKAAALLEQIRRLRKSPEAAHLVDELAQTAGEVGQSVQSYKDALLEARRRQVEFEFGGRS